MLRKLVALVLAFSFLTMPFSYFVEGSEEEEEEILPECSWNNPCEIHITDGDLDNLLIGIDFSYLKGKNRFIGSFFMDFC